MASSTQANHQVIIHRCLYTHDLVRKSKRWQDGTIHFHTFNRRMRVYDLTGNVVGDMHDQNGRRSVEEGEYITGFGGGIHVDVSEQMQVKEPDLSGLFEKKPPKPITEIAATGQSTVAVPTNQPPQMGHRAGIFRINKLPPGPAQLPMKSPFEQRQIDCSEPVQTAPDSRKRRLDERDDEHVPIRQLLSKTRPGGVYGQPLHVSKIAHNLQAPGLEQTNKRRYASGRENNSLPHRLVPIEVIADSGLNKSREKHIESSSRPQRSENSRSNPPSAQLRERTKDKPVERPLEEGRVQHKHTHKSPYTTASRSEQSHGYSTSTHNLPPEKRNAGKVGQRPALEFTLPDTEELRNHETLTTAEASTINRPADNEDEGRTASVHNQDASIDSLGGDGHKKREKLKPLELPSTRRKRKSLLCQALSGGSKRNKLASASRTDLQPNIHAEESLPNEAAPVALLQDGCKSSSDKVSASPDAPLQSLGPQNLERVNTAAPLRGEQGNIEIRRDFVSNTTEADPGTLSKGHEQPEEFRIDPPDRRKRPDLAQSPPAGRDTLDTRLLTKNLDQRYLSSHEAGPIEVNPAQENVGAVQADQDDTILSKAAVAERALSRGVRPSPSLSRFSRTATSNKQSRMQGTNLNRVPPRSTRRVTVTSKSQIGLQSAESNQERQEAVAEIQDPWSVEAWDLLGFLPPDKPFATELNGTDKANTSIQ